MPDAHAVRQCGSEGPLVRRRASSPPVAPVLKCNREAPPRAAKLQVSAVLRGCSLFPTATRPRKHQSTKQLHTETPGNFFVALPFVFSCFCGLSPRSSQRTAGRREDTPFALPSLAFAKSSARKLRAAAVAVLRGPWRLFAVTASFDTFNCRKTSLTAY